MASGQLTASGRLIIPDYGFNLDVTDEDDNYQGFETAAESRTPTPTSTSTTTSRSTRRVIDIVENSESGEIVTCSVCHYTFRNVAVLQEHLLARHCVQSQKVAVEEEEEVSDEDEVSEVEAEYSVIEVESAGDQNPTQMAHQGFETCTVCHLKVRNVATLQEHLLARHCVQSQEVAELLKMHQLLLTTVITLQTKQQQSIESIAKDLTHMKHHPPPSSVSLSQSPQSFPVQPSLQPSPSPPFSPPFSPLSSPRARGGLNLKPGLSQQPLLGLKLSR